MRRGVYAVAVIVVAVGLGGCQGDGAEPTPSPSAAPDGTSSGSPSPSTSPSPEAESAEDFIRRWVEVRNEMQNTGDTTEYRQLSKGCRPCSDVADRVEEVYQAGGFIRTDGWNVLKTERVRKGADSWVYHVRVDNARTEYRESSGAAVQSIDSGRPTLELAIRRSEEFRVIGLAQVPD